jgi:hypothetical protein
MTLILWTAPFVATYGALGLLRRVSEMPSLAHMPVIGPVAQVAGIAAMRLQKANRVLKYSSDCSSTDIRILYALSTFEGVCAIAPWTFGVMPGLVGKLGTPILVRVVVGSDGCVIISHCRPTGTICGMHLVYMASVVYLAWHQEISTCERRVGWGMEHGCRS